MSTNTRHTHSKLLDALPLNDIQLHKHVALEQEGVQAAVALGSASDVMATTLAVCKKTEKTKAMRQ